MKVVIVLSAFVMQIERGGGGEWLINRGKKVLGGGKRAGKERFFFGGKKCKANLKRKERVDGLNKRK